MIKRDLQGCRRVLGRVVDVVMRSELVREQHLIRSRAGIPAPRIDSQETLPFSTLTGVRPRTEIIPLERAAEGYERVMSGKARFRIVLTTRN